MRYAAVEFPRAGLANKLFVLARAVVYCAEHGGVLLQPNYFSFKLGPLLRRETDLRTYLGLFEKHPTVEIGGMRKAVIWASTKKVFEQSPPPHLCAGAIRVFRRTCETFDGINGYNELLSSYLQETTRPKWLAAAERVGAVEIGVHVRLGDLTGHSRHPIEWYVDAVEFVRSIAGPLAVTVFSDGRDSELAPLLAMPGVHVARTGSAISDMLALSRSRFLIGTGSSTFSAWAAYLGQMPAMTRVSNPFSWWALENVHGRFIGEWNPTCPDEKLIENISALGRQ